MYQTYNTIFLRKRFNLHNSANAVNGITSFVVIPVLPTPWYKDINGDDIEGGILTKYADIKNYEDRDLYNHARSALLVIKAEKEF